MKRTAPLPSGMKIIIGFHLFNIILWTIGQGGAIVSYDTVAQWGLQDSRELIDPVIVEVNKGIGLADIIIMMPLFLIAITGLWRLKLYGGIASWMAFGITIYWPVVFFSSQYFYSSAGIKYQPTSLSTTLFLTLLMIFALWASWYLLKNYRQLK